MSKRVWHFPQKVDINKIKRASKVLIGKYDFNAFRSSNCQAKTSIRTIDEIKVKKEKECIEIRVWKILYAQSGQNNSGNFVKNWYRSD